MRSNPKPLEMYRHFKGNIYQIRCLAKHSETGETMVVYQAMYDTFQIYVRPLAMFMDEVDRSKYPEAKQRYRFELLQDMDNIGQEAEQPRTVAAQTQTAERTKTMGQPQTAEQAKTVRQPQEAEQPKTVRQTQTAEQPAVSEQPSGTNEDRNEEVNIDPLVMEFLDADTYERKLDVLTSLRPRITDDMINTMAAAVDLEIKDGDVETRYEEFKNCLLTFEKYECNRLR